MMLILKSTLTLHSRLDQKRKKKVLRLESVFGYILYIYHHPYVRPIITHVILYVVPSIKAEPTRWRPSSENLVYQDQ